MENSNTVFSMGARTLVVIIIFCLNTPNLYCQFQKSQFRFLTITEGLTQNAVLDIIQDRKGFMWFGTKDGLNRYDGYEFVNYTHSPEDTTSLVNNNIKALFEDPSGKIWIGTQDGMVDVYDPVNECFHHMTIEGEQNSKFSISDIVGGNDGTIFIGTKGKGVLRGNFEDKTFRPFDSGNVPLIINELLYEKDSILWAVTKDGFYKTIFNDTEVANSEKIPLPAFIANSTDEDVFSILKDEIGRFWIGGISGLYLYQPGRKVGGKDIEATCRMFQHRYAVYRRGWGNIVSMEQGPDGKIWLGTPEDLIVFDTLNYSFNFLEGKSTTIPKIGVYKVFRDRSGVMWLGSNGAGVSIYSRHSNRFGTFRKPFNPEDRLQHFSIRSIFEDHDENVWISAGLLYKWDPVNNIFKSFETDSKHVEDFGNTEAWSIIQQDNGIMWFGSFEGLYRYDPSTQEIKHYKKDIDKKGGLPGKIVYEVFEDKNGKIWVICESFICRLNEEKGIFDIYDLYSSLPPPGAPRYESIYEDKYSNFWINSYTGLIKFDPGSGEQVLYNHDPANFQSLNFNDIKCILPDPDKPDSILWLGTAGGGVNRFYIYENRFQHITEKDGLPNNVVYGILPDKSGNLWMSTNKGIARYDPSTKMFQNFNSYDGLQSDEFNSGAFHLGESGTLYFGGIQGLNYFKPEEISRNESIPPIAITELKIANRKINLSNGTGILNKSIDFSDGIKLPYNANIFSLKFAALEFSNPLNNQYVYTLEGFNSEWIKAEESRVATYTNIPPGNYIFKVKASNSDGVWNEQGTALKLHILPPFWKTNIAYFIYLLGVSFLLILWYRYYLHRQRLKNSLLFEKMEKEKVLEISRLKTNFFDNISHDLRTPLTMIKGPVEDLLEKVTVYDHRQTLLGVLKNSDRLLDLINQIIDIGRIENKGFKLEYSRIEFVGFVKGLASSYDYYASSRAISFSFFSNSDSICTHIDAEGIEKVFHNLVSNAFKNTPGGGMIEIRVERLQNSLQNNEVQVIIENSGSTIPNDVFPRLFDKYYSTEKSNSSSGLGLTIAKEMIGMHGGNIWAENTDYGVQFIFVIPVVIEEVLDTRDFQPSLPQMDFNDNGASNIELETRIDNKNKPLVLIIEDTLDLQDFIAQIVNKNYQVICASDGSEGYEIAIESVPDLIITDLMMPGMDGVTLCEKLKVDMRTSHIPIIILTARAMSDDRLKGIESGADHYITKPFSSRELESWIENLLQQRARLQKSFSNGFTDTLKGVAINSTDKDFIAKVMRKIEEEKDNENFSPADLGAFLNISDRQMRRKIKALFDLTPTHLIRKYRLQYAKRLIQSTDYAINEICYKVGFNDPAYFSKCYKEEYGHSPSEVRSF